MWSYFLFIEVRFWNEKHDGDGFNLLLHFSKKPWHTAYEVVRRFGVNIKSVRIQPGKV